MATKTDVLNEAAYGKGCLGKSADDEPVFVLCARDPLAANLVRDWADDYERFHVRNGTYTIERKQKVTDARRASLAMDEWRTRPSNQAAVDALVEGPWSAEHPDSGVAHRKGCQCSRCMAPDSPATNDEAVAHHPV